MLITYTVYEDTTCTDKQGIKQQNQQTSNKHHTSSGKKMSLVILGTEWNSWNARVKG